MSNQIEALKLALEALEQIKQETFHPAKVFDHNHAITAIREALAQPEFIKHVVENDEDWSEWVCPDPKGYLMKCCDCGLVHEAQFKVVRYKSEDEREECDPVNDPNLQAVFRMRRSEEWTPEDTAYRPGGLAQPEQEPVAWGMMNDDGKIYDCICPEEHDRFEGEYTVPLYTTPPQRKPLTDEEIESINVRFAGSRDLARLFARAIEAAHGIKE